MSKKPDGTKKNRDQVKGKSDVRKEVEIKPRGPRPDFTPKVVKQSQAEKNAAINAEGTPEAKKALAAGNNGLYFICGEFLKIRSKSINDNVTGEFRMEIHVIEDENENHIPFTWVLIPDHKWETMKLNGSQERIRAMKAIRQIVLEYAGQEIKEVKIAFAVNRKKEEEQRIFAAKVAEANARITSSASADLAAMFWRRQDGTFAFPDGVVMQVVDSKAEVVIGNSEFGVSKRGKESFFLPMSTLSIPMINPNGKIKGEKTRAALYAWQSKVHDYLVTAKAVTPQPTTAKSEVKASKELDDMFRKNIAGNYAVGNLVVKLDASSPKGLSYRVQVGNDQVPASERNFLPSSLLDKVIAPNGNITDEEARMKIHSWQVALQTVLKTAKAKLPPVVEETSKVAEVVTQDALSPVVSAYKPKCLEIPSLKSSTHLTVEMLKSMTSQTTGLFHLQEGRGRAYLFAKEGKMFLVQKSDTFPKDHVLTRILDLHSNKKFEESELVYIDIHTIRQEQRLDEVADVSECKQACRAMQRFFRRMMLEVAEVKSENVAVQTSASSKDSNFPPNTVFASLLANVKIPKGSEQSQLVH